MEFRVICSTMVINLFGACHTETPTRNEVLVDCATEKTDATNLGGDGGDRHLLNI